MLIYDLIVKFVDDNEQVVIPCYNLKSARTCFDNALKNGHNVDSYTINRRNATKEELQLYGEHRKVIKMLRELEGDE